MSRYQIKEALDKIACHTQFNPNSSNISMAGPGDVRLQCSNSYGQEALFRYANGQLYKWSDADENWQPVDSLPANGSMHALYGYLH